MAKSQTIADRAPRLNDLQRVLLSTASQRESGSLLPVAESIGGKAVAVRRGTLSLLKRELMAEVDVAARDQVWRDTGDRRVGVVITAAGRDAIGDATVGPDEVGGEPVGDSTPAETEVPTSPRPPSKTARVIALLQRAEGATLTDLIETTGWLPHTTRAALTGLRKKGHAIQKGKRGDTTCYRIAAVEIACESDTPEQVAA